MSFYLNRRQLISIIAVTLSGFIPGVQAGVKTRPVQLFRKFNINNIHLAKYAELYLSKHPEENNRKSLESLIFNSSSFYNIREMKKFLRVKIANDFRIDKVVNLDGWILSETEVRLWCLLYVALSESK
jgi:hypothetical protein